MNLDRLHVRPFGAGWFYVFFCLVLLSAPANAMEFKDLEGYWSGKGVQIDPETGNTMDSLPVTLQAFARDGEPVVLYNIMGICVAVKPEFREDGFRFLWAAMDIDVKKVGDRLEMEHISGEHTPPFKISLSKEPVFDLTDEQVSGIYAGRLLTSIGAPEARADVVYDVQIEVRLNGDEAYAAMKGTRMGLKGRGRTKPYSVEFVRVERYGNRLILWTQTPEEAEAHKARILPNIKSDHPELAAAFVHNLEQERVYLNLKPNGDADAQFNIQAFGNAVGTVKKQEEEKPEEEKR